MAQAAFDSGDFLRCLEITGAEPSEANDRLAAQCCIRIGRFDEAIDRLDSMITARPEDGTLLIERKAVAGQLCLLKAEAANELFKAGELQAAMAAYSSINLDDCSDAAKFSICNNRGALYLQGGKATEALADFESALTVKSSSIDALHNRASALKVMGNAAEALAGFDACLDMDADFYLGLCGKSECLSMLSRFEDAIASSTTAILLSPDQTRAFVNRGFAKLKSGVVDAVVDFELAVAAGDDSDETDRLLAIALSVEGDRFLAGGKDEDAVNSYEKALCHGSQGTPNLNVLFNYALAQLHLGQRTEALEGLKYVASLATPGKLLYEASWAAGLICLQDSDAVTALGYLEAAVQLKPGNVDAQYNLGVARLQAKNDSVGALSCFHKVLEIDPGHISAKQAAELVGGLDSSKAQLMAAAREKANEPAAPPVQVPMPAKDPTPDTSWVGKTVVVHGLVNKAEMNGVSGVVASFDPTNQRYCVKVQVKDQEVVAKLKPLNFKLHDGTPPPPPPTTVSAPATVSAASEAASEPVSLEKSMGELHVAPRKSSKRSVRASFVMSVTYTLEELRSGAFGEGVDKTRKETYLGDEAFEAGFKMTRDEFSRLPNWKKANKRKELKIF